MENVCLVSVAALLRAAHTTQQWPNGTINSRPAKLFFTDNSTVSVVRPCRNAVSTKEDEISRCGLKARREKHCSLRSDCRCIGRHCCACQSKNVRGAGCSLDDRKRKRVHNRMTGLVDAVAGNPRIDCHRDTDLDVRVTNRSNFAISTSASGRTVKSLWLKHWKRGHAWPMRCLYQPRPGRPVE